MDAPSTLRSAAQSLSGSGVPWHEALAGWLLDAAGSIEPQVTAWVEAGRGADQLVETYYRWPLQVARAVIEEVTREPQHG